MPLLATKLYTPPPRSKLVLRPHLIARLNEGLNGKLTLISAPAGFGKTTLVSEWVAGCDRPAAWLSLDEGDSDITRFLMYLVAALRSIAANLGEAVLAALQSAQPPPTELLLTALLNEIATLQDRSILVLDDYHLIDAHPVDQAISFLIEHMPPQLHLLIATREDPQLPLARLRARGHLAELRAADLRFTTAEAARLLTQAVGRDLPAEAIAALETRTEGWVAGLQLAAISLRGRHDPAGFIRTFTGSDRFVMDYLVEEVLRQQPASVQAFLLRTSMLNRLCGPLCDAVLLDPSAAGQATLEYLEHANLFVVPLDNQRRWYRYHQLFAEVLRQRLHQDIAASLGDAERGVAELHERASLWYQAHGLELEALHHAAAANNAGLLARMAELAWPALDRSFQSAAWLRSVQQLPNELIAAMPVLSAQYAWALLDAGEMEASQLRLQDAERWLDATGDASVRPEDRPGRMVVVDEAQFQTLPATIAIARAYYAQAQGDYASAASYAALALQRTPEANQDIRAQATVLLGFSYWANGNLDAAYNALADWIERMWQVGNAAFAIISTFYLVEPLVAQGRLREAAGVYQHSLQLAEQHDMLARQLTAHTHVGLALLYHERGDAEASARHMRQGEEFGRQALIIDWPYRWCLAQARLKEAEGDLDAVLGLLDQARRHYVRNPVPDFRPIEALQARVYIKQGRLANAREWADAHGLSVSDDLSYLHEFEHITLARLRIAEYRHDRADRSLRDGLGLLARLLTAAEAGRRMASVIEILVLQALAHELQGSLPLALASLERGLTLAEPEGYIRIFVDEGPPMLRLLSAAAARAIMPGYVSTLLAACRTHAADAPVGAGLGKPAAPGPQPLLEPLSRRELEILRLVAQGLSNQQISVRLSLALSTVKGHLLRMFGKLQVQRRTEAVARARELGLL